MLADYMVGLNLERMCGQISDRYTPATNPVFSDENVPGYVEDQGVEVAGVECQGVIIVEAIDLYVSQAHFVVGKNGIWVD